MCEQNVFERVGKAFSGQFSNIFAKISAKMMVKTLIRNHPDSKPRGQKNLTTAPNHRMTKLVLMVLISEQHSDSNLQARNGVWTGFFQTPRKL